MPVTTIGNYAFCHCDSLTNVEIPDSVTTIGEDAFECCSSLASVYYKGTSVEWNNISKRYGNGYLTDATRYYYIEDEADVPTGGGTYWHYYNDGNVVIW